VQAEDLWNIGIEQVTIVQMSSTASSPSSTPILDLKIPLPKGNPWDRPRIWRAVLVVVAILASGYLVLRAGFVLRENIQFTEHFFDSVVRDLDTFSLRAGSLTPLYLFLTYIVSTLAIVAIHEGGHVAGGLSVGFRFEKVRVGPFVLNKSPQGPKLTYQLASKLDGITVMRVPRMSRVRRKYLVYSSAGAIANLLAGLFVCLFLMISTSSISAPAMRVPLELFAAYSFLVAFLNLIPHLRRNGMFTDGGRLLSLIRSKPKTKRLLSRLALAAQIESGDRPRNLNQNWITNACAISDRSNDALQSFLFGYLSACDREIPERAAYYLERCLQRIELASPETKKMILMEAAIFQAWFRDDAAKAEVWFERSKAGPTLPPLNDIRLNICLNWARKRYADVAADFEKVRVLIENLPASAAKTRLVEGWHEWKETIDKKRGERESQAIIVET
jgi:hypothetical protein